ncbi:MAG TPA: DUF998 domain-containing protein [Caldilineaceae bacterium]|nr:DUF998 domain-containing protein [Caldilineaceae bacterium]
MARKVLLICGILAALLYIGSDILAALSWEGYSYTAQSVSELRAIGAPTRSFLMPILLIYTLLEIAFGFGVWRAATPGGLPKRSLRIAGALLIGLGVLDLIGPLFSLNLNEAAGSLANTIHVIVTAVTLLLLLLVIGFGATANGRWFRLYSYATILLFIVTGVWSFLELPRIAANLPTPWLGVRERMGIFGYMLWLAVFAIVLWRDQATTAAGRPPADAGTPRLMPR